LVAGILYSAFIGYRVPLALKEFFSLIPEHEHKRPPQTNKLFFKHKRTVDFTSTTNKQVTVMAAELEGLNDLDGQEIDSNWDEVRRPVSLSPACFFRHFLRHGMDADAVPP
jgi:hypothetical protein